MSVSLTISFDNDRHSFYPGQTIRGKVTFSNDSEIKVKGLTVTFFGEAEVYWTESDVVQRDDNINRSSQNSLQRRHIHREYRNQETILCHEITLFGQANEEGGNEHVLPPGVQQYSFAVQLPNFGLPSSFSESPYGFVKYSAEARLKRPLFRYDKAELEFFVSGTLDLNFMPQVLEPFGVDGRMEFGWICCTDGYATADLRLQKTGFFPGEQIPFTVLLLNCSSVVISQVYAKFIRDMHFITFDRKRVTSTDMQISAYGNTVETGGVAEWNNYFVVPPGLPPTNLAGCRIINITYRITVRIQGADNILNLTAPITIGTEPGPTNSRATESENANVTTTGDQTNHFPQTENEELQTDCNHFGVEKSEYNASLNPFLNTPNQNDDNSNYA